MTNSPYAAKSGATLVRIQIVNLDQANSSAVVFPTHNGCIRSWLKIEEHSCFAIICGGQAGIDQRLFLIHPPIVILREQGPIPVVDSQGRIAQGPADAMI